MPSTTTSSRRGCGWNGATISRNGWARWAKRNWPGKSRSWTLTRRRWKAFASGSCAWWNAVSLKNPMSRLDQHIPIVGQQAVDELRLLGSHLQGRVMRHISSTAVGGGAAGILHRSVPYFREFGVDAKRAVGKGNADFSTGTRKP